MYGFIDTPNPKTVTIEFYANPAPNPTGHGDGETLIGTANPKNSGKISAELPLVTPGTFVSAIAIDSENNTSEFSLSIEATGEGGNNLISNPSNPNVEAMEPSSILAVKAFPNPFSWETTIAFQLAYDQRVKLSVFDATGHLIQVVTDGYQQEGAHRFRFDASDLPPGMYTYQLITESKVQSGRIIKVENSR